MLAEQRSLRNQDITPYQRFVEDISQVAQSLFPSKDNPASIMAANYKLGEFGIAEEKLPNFSKALGEHFRIQISLSDAQSWRTCDDICEYLAEHGAVSTYNPN